MKLKRMRFGTVLGAVLFAGAAIAQTGSDHGHKDVRERVKNAKQMYKDGKLAEALGEFEQLATEVPDSIDVEAWLGFLYLQSHRSHDAIAPLEKAAAARPNDLEINSNLGSAYLDDKNNDKALTQYLLVERLNPRFPQASYNIGTLYLAKNDYSDAVSAFRRAVDLAPNDSYAWNDLGFAYEGQKDMDDAQKAYLRAVSLKPDEPAFERNAGLACYKHHQYSVAVPYLEFASKSNVASTELSLALAECYSETRNYSAAASVYDSLKDSQGSNAAFWFNIGYLKQRSNNTTDAEVAYRKCLDIDGNDLDALNNLGLLLYKKGNYADAEVLFDKLSGLAHGKESNAAKHNLAVAAMQAGDNDKAMEAWKDLIHSDPDAVEPRVQLADAMWKKGDVAGAKHQYAQALLQDPNNVAAMNGMGLVRLHDTKLHDAETAFRACIAADPKFVPAYNNLALTLEKLNRRADAIRVLSKASKIDPNNEDVTKNLERMKAAQ